MIRGRRIIDPTAGPLFAGFQEEADRASSTIYVLRSKSDHPTVAPNRDLVHIEHRIAGARLHPPPRDAKDTQEPKTCGMFLSGTAAILAAMYGANGL